MPQLKIICLAHPVTWSDYVNNIEPVEQRILALNPNNKSWFDHNTERGGRSGIYKIEKLEKLNNILLQFIAESDINEDYSSVEKLLADDNCLPEDIEIPIPIPRALKMYLFFDISEGIFYAYTPGLAPKNKLLFNILERLQKDTQLHMTTAKVFEWKEELVTTVTEIARKDGYNPYKVQADLENVKIAAEGDLENNEEWKKIEGAIDLGKWRTIAYVKPNNQGMFVFGLTRRRNKQISMPLIDVHLSMDKLHERILNIRSLVEGALGCDVRQYCFRDLTPLTQFL